MFFIIFTLGGFLSLAVSGLNCILCVCLIFLSLFKTQGQIWHLRSLKLCYFMYISQLYKGELLPNKVCELQMIVY